MFAVFTKKGKVNIKRWGKGITGAKGEGEKQSCQIYILMGNMEKSWNPKEKTKKKL